MPNPYTDTPVSDMIFNVLDSETYNTLLSNSQLNNNQLYFITDDVHTLTFTKNNSTIGTYNGSANLTIDLTSANKAINDGEDQPIASTYIKNATKGDHKITFTKGNNTTFDVATDDTKNTAGATGSTSKLFLIGATTQGANPQTYSNSAVYMTNGTLTATKFVGALEGNATSATSATKATNDGSDQPIASTYIKDATISGNVITFKKGNNNTDLTITLPTYTDTKVTQTAVTASSYTNWRPLIWGASNSATEGFTPSTVTDGVFTANTLSVQPSSGTIRATTFKGSLSGNAATATKATNDSNDQNIADTYIKDISTTATSGTAITVKYGDNDTKTVYVPTYTDTKVTQAAPITTNANYPILLGYSNTSTTTAYTNTVNRTGTGVYINPATSTIKATTFSGNATSATKATNDSNDNPISSTYFKAIDFGNDTITFTRGNNTTATAVAPWLALAGGQVTGPVSFGDAVNIDDLTASQAVITGSASIANNLQVNTINGVTVGNNPKFTDTTYNIATSSSNGLVKPWWHLTGSTTGVSASSYTNAVTVNARSTTAGRYYAVEIDNAGRLFVNVPWTNVNSSYITDASATQIMHYKGTKASASALPTSGNAQGDVWHVTDTTTEYAWNGSGWEELGRYASFPTSTGSKTTGISIANHSTASIYGVSSSTNTIYGVKSGTNSTTTASHVKNGGNGSAPTYGDPIVLRGVGSSTTTASKVTLGTAFSVPNISGTQNVTVPVMNTSDTTVPKAATSATTVPKAAASATTVPIKAASATPCDDITAWSAGSGSASLTFTMDTTDTKKLKIGFSHTHTAPSLSYSAKSIIGVQDSTTSVTGVSGSVTVTGVSGSVTVRGVRTDTSANATLVTKGTNFTIPNVTGVSDVDVPIKNTNETSIPNVTSVGSPSSWVFEDVTVPIRDSGTAVPIKNGTATTVVTSAGHTITDPGHTHSI